jgi:uncharacterized protein YegP (UPF0339 family)
MAAKFVLKVAKDGQYYFNLKAGNGETTLTSEMYQAKAGALNGIESVKKNSPDESRFEKLVSSNGKPYFVLKAANHQVIGNSEMYNSEAARDNGIEAVMRDGPVAAIEEVASA